MTQAGKVAEIFSTAGEAFTKLGQLAMSLQPVVERSQQDVGKWGEVEMEMLKKAVQQFGTDIERISDRIKTKSAVQIKSVLKQKAIQNLTENTGTSLSKTTTSPQLNSSPIKLQQSSVQRIIGQKNKINDSTVFLGQQPQKKTKVDIPTNMNILTAIPQIRSMAVRPNTSGLPIVASNQGFQVLLPQPQMKTTSAVVPPVMRTSIPGVSVVRTNPVVVPISTLASLPTGSIPVPAPLIPTVLPIVSTNCAVTLSDSYIAVSNSVQKIHDSNTSANVDVES